MLILFIWIFQVSNLYCAQKITPWAVISVKKLQTFNTFLSFPASLSVVAAAVSVELKPTIFPNQADFLTSKVNIYTICKPLPK